MGLDIMYGDRKKVTFRCLEGGMEWGTASDCGLNWTSIHMYTNQSHISQYQLHKATAPVVLIVR